MLRIGIVGVGATVSIAHYHAQGYIDEEKRCRICGVYDINREAAEAWIISHGLDAKAVDSFDDLLDLVDAISICTPNAFHFQYAEKALARGVSVLVEKPLAMDVSECRVLADLARSGNAYSMVGMVYRYCSIVQKARKIIDERFSSIYTIDGHFGGKRLANPGNPLEWRMIRRRSGSGAIGDFGSHLVDVSYFLTGIRFDEVSCFSSTSIRERSFDGGTGAVENDDSAVMICRKGDTVASYAVSRIGMDDLRLLITGDAGMIEVALRGKGELTYWEKDRDGGYTGRIEVLQADEDIPFDDWFRKEISSFIDGIEGKANQNASFDEAVYVEDILQRADGGECV